MPQLQPEFSFVDQGVPPMCYETCPDTNFKQVETVLREAALDAALVPDCDISRAGVTVLRARVAALTVHAISLIPSDEQRGQHTGPWLPDGEAVLAAGVSPDVVGPICCQSCSLTLRVGDQSIKIRRPDPS
ncbi:MAG TPA: hypothetical protein VLI54_06840 [Bacillota bacterium]|nr:hypothetical protein [Bacillota bacterium]